MAIGTHTRLWQLLPAFAVAIYHLTRAQAFVTPHHHPKIKQHSPISQNIHEEEKPCAHSRQTVFNTMERWRKNQKPSSTELYGIPKMFRWLTDQYPNINSRLSEGLSSDKVVDNFYLDMNGIIHPCTHGNNQDDIVILDETLMFKKIFGYVDR